MKNLTLFTILTSYKKVKEKLKHCTIALFVSCFLFIQNAHADGVIPDLDPSQQNKSWMETLKYYLLEYGAPIIVYGGAIWLISQACWGMLQGYKAYQRSQEFGEFKTGLIGGVIMISVAVLMFAFGGQIIDKWSSS